MNPKLRSLLVLGALLAAQLACNLPAQPGGDSTGIPAPNQTLTALFAITQGGTATVTLPPVTTATRPPANPTAAQPPTATFTLPAPTATRSQPGAPTATQTTAPRPTVTIPGVRPRNPVIAPFFTTPPTLDGDWSEWKEISTEYPAGNVVFGRDKWIGEDDLQASFHVGWDNNYFYVAVKVRDERYAQNASGENLYLGDSIELLLDTKLQEDYYWDQLSPDDFQLGISPGRPDPSGTKEAYLWLPGNIAGPRPGVQIASRLDDFVYRVEAAIPWSVFEMTPTAGMHMGFALSVSDNDDTSQNLQESMVSNLATRRRTDPTTWGDLRLEK
jgi:hypothetical protein